MDQPILALAQMAKQAAKAIDYRDGPPLARSTQALNGEAPPRSLDRMSRALSPRLAAIVDALPLRSESRVLEIGCGTGAAARAIAARLVGGHILGIDRSRSAVAQATAAAAELIASGRMSVRHVAAEDLTLRPGEQPYDLVFAVRVGALDGRHPKVGELVLGRIALANDRRRSPIHRWRRPTS